MPRPCHCGNARAGAYVVGQCLDCWKWLNSPWWRHRWGKSPRAGSRDQILVGCENRVITWMPRRLYLTVLGVRPQPGPDDDRLDAAFRGSYPLDYVGLREVAASHMRQVWQYYGPMAGGRRRNIGLHLMPACAGPELAFALSAGAWDVPPEKYYSCVGPRGVQSEQRTDNPVRWEDDEPVFLTSSASEPAFLVDDDEAPDEDQVRPRVRPLPPPGSGRPVSLKFMVTE